MIRRIPLALVVLMASGLITSTASAQYAIGTADVTYVDAARGGRNVPVDLYYPAVSAGAGQPVADAPAPGFAAVSIGHGYLMAPSVYGWLARELAAIGCVVAVSRTGGELFPNHQTFGLDLAFLARSLCEAGGDPGSPFFGRMGAKNAVMGHCMERREQFSRRGQQSTDHRRGELRGGRDESLGDRVVRVVHSARVDVRGHE
jgi:hypothetical protein